MTHYLLRRILYAIPILLGVNLITFLLFFVVNSPDDMARSHLGRKHMNAVVIEEWKKNHGYDKPLFYNSTETGFQQWTKTLFFTKSLKLFTFDFGLSDAGRNIIQDIRERLWPSLAIALPSLILGLIVNISFALLLVFFRATYLDTWGMMICIMMLSLSSLFYIIVGQFLFSGVLRLVPISGYETGWSAIKFLALPIFISVLSGFGANVRWYRSLFLEEIQKDYVRTARAKGLSELCVLFRHVLRNALIPILTGVVVIIPSLFMGSLLLESFFSIPGLGSYTIEAIHQQDFAIVRVMVFLGTLLYMLGLLLTDLSYTWVDPRIRFS